MLPYVVPPIALVVGVIGAFRTRVPWFFNSRYSLIPFYTVLAMPFTYRALDAGLRAIDLRTLVDASRSRGAGWATTMFRVLVPNLRASLLTSAFLTATVVMGEFTMAALMGKTTFQAFTSQFSQRSAAGRLRPRLAHAPRDDDVARPRHLPHPPTRRRGRRRRRRLTGRVPRGIDARLTRRSARRSPGRPRSSRSTWPWSRASWSACSGPSGCGKTTALRIAAGFEQPDAGAILVDGRDVVGHAAAQAQHGHGLPELQPVPQPRRRGNVAFGLRVRRVSEGRAATPRRRSPRAGPPRRTSPTATRTSSPAASSSASPSPGPSSFEPAVLLLDEPLSALDAKVRVGLREEIRRLQLQLGMTTLFVTHDQEEALSISDRIGVMSNGRLEQLGTPREVYAEPANAVRRPLRRPDQRAARRGHRRRDRRRRRAHRRRRSERRRGGQPP